MAHGSPLRILILGGTAEASAHLSNGDAYVDLDELEKGVMHAKGNTPPMGRVLPKKAVSGLAGALAARR